MAFLIAPDFLVMEISPAPTEGPISIPPSSEIFSPFI
jgi:hypothetical protein